MVFLHSFTGKKLHAINMGSYNYLGFAEREGACADQAEEATRSYSLGVCGFRHELGRQRSEK